MESIILACILTFSSVIIVESISGGRKGKPFDSFFLISCEAILFVIEVLFTLGFVVTFMRLRRLRQSRPYCVNQNCDKDTDPCAECSALKDILKKRLLTILRVYVWFMVICLVETLNYSASKVTTIMFISLDKPIDQIWRQVFLSI